MPRLIRLSIALAASLSLASPALARPTAPATKPTTLPATTSASTLPSSLLTEEVTLPPAVAAANRAARELAEATLSGDIPKILDLTYEPMIAGMGGRNQAIKTAEDTFKKAKAGGMVIQSLEVDMPAEPIAEGAHSFVVVPTRMQMRVPGAILLLDSFVLGISPDGGKAWRFVEGGSLSDPEIEKIIPKLPVALKLPTPRQPKLVKDVPPADPVPTPDVTNLDLTPGKPATGPATKSTTAPTNTTTTTPSAKK